MRALAIIAGSVVARLANGAGWACLRAGAACGELMLRAREWGRRP